MLSVSLLVISLDNTILNVALPDDRARSRRRRADSSSGSSTPTPWSSPACSSPWAASATASAGAARSCRASSCSAQDRCLGASPARRHADRQPRADGRRRRADHADDALDPHERLPRRGAAEGDRDLGGGRRARHRHRPRGRRLAASSTSTGARVFLVNVPIVVAALAAAPRARARLARSRRSRGSTRSAPCSPRPASACSPWAIIEAAASAAGPTASSLGGFGAAPAVLAAFVAWELRTPSPMLDVRALPGAPLHGASVVDRAGVLRPVRGDLLPDPVPPGGDGLRRARGRAARSLPVAVGLVARRPAVGEARGPLRHPRVVAARAHGGRRRRCPDVRRRRRHAATARSPPRWSLLGFGMGATMAPATESIMSSLPLAHAGVGSAMNDTVRLVGGTLGVAILGSLLSSGYGADMEEAVEGAARAGRRGGRRLARRTRARSPTRSAATPERPSAGGRDRLQLRHGHDAHGRRRQWRSPARCRAGGAARAASRERGREAAPMQPEAGARVSADGAGSRTTGRRRGGAGPRSWRPRSEEARPRDPRRDAETLGRTGTRGIDHRGRRRPGGRGQDDDLPALAGQVRADPGRLTEYRPAGPARRTPAAWRATWRPSRTRSERVAGARLAGIVPRLLAESDERPRAARRVTSTGDRPRSRDLLRMFIERGVERGELRPDFDVDVAVDRCTRSRSTGSSCRAATRLARRRARARYLPLLAAGNPQ